MHYHSASEKALQLVTELKSIGVRAIALQADLADYDQVRRLHTDVVEKLGHPDILFNNAGVTGKVIGRMGNLGDISIEEYEKTWKVNTGSSYLACYPCLRRMPAKLRSP